jgi:hypothetical protein
MTHPGLAASREEPMKYIFVLICLCLSTLRVSAEDGELSNEDILKEIKEGPAYKPDHIIISAKPISFIFGQNLGDAAPYPMKCLQVKARLYKSLGMQAEPVFIVGGKGGYGFTVGPTYIPDGLGDEVQVTPKYEFEYINTMGAYHGLMLELTRHRLFRFLAISYGGAVGFAVNGATATGGSDGESKILSVEQGLTFDVNLGLGFAL